MVSFDPSPDVSLPPEEVLNGKNVCLLPVRTPVSLLNRHRMSRSPFASHSPLLVGLDSIQIDT